MKILTTIAALLAASAAQAASYDNVEFLIQNTNSAYAREASNPYVVTFKVLVKKNGVPSYYNGRNRDYSTTCGTSDLVVYSDDYSLTWTAENFANLGPQAFQDIPGSACSKAFPKLPIMQRLTVAQVEAATRKASEDEAAKAWREVGEILRVKEDRETAIRAEEKKAQADHEASLLVDHVVPGTDRHIGGIRPFNKFLSVGISLQMGIVVDNTTWLGKQEQVIKYVYVDCRRNKLIEPMDTYYRRPDYLDLPDGEAAARYACELASPKKVANK